MSLFYHRVHASKGALIKSKKLIMFGLHYEWQGNN